MHSVRWASLIIWGIIEILTSLSSGSARTVIGRHDAFSIWDGSNQKRLNVLASLAFLIKVTEHIITEMVHLECNTGQGLYSEEQRNSSREEWLTVTVAKKYTLVQSMNGQSSYNGHLGLDPALPLHWLSVTRSGLESCLVFGFYIQEQRFTWFGKWYNETINQRNKIVWFLSWEPSYCSTGHGVRADSCSWFRPRE